MKNNIVSNIIQVIFTLVGVGMLIGGYFAAPGALTDDGYPLNHFFYTLGAFFILWPLLLFGVIRFFQRRNAKKIADLKANGVKGKARVLGMKRTGVSVNRIPQMILELDVRTDLGQLFTTSYKKCIDPLYYNLVRPDLDLPVYVDAANQKNIYIDFEEAWAKAAES